MSEHFDHGDWNRFADSVAGQWESQFGAERPHETAQPKRYAADVPAPPLVMCLLSTDPEPVICDGGCGLARCPKRETAA